MLKISALNQFKSTSFGSLPNKGTKVAKKVAGEIAQQATDGAKKVTCDVFQKVGSEKGLIKGSYGLAEGFKNAPKAASGKPNLNKAKGLAERF